MKNLFTSILFFISLIVFSQNIDQYERTISYSQFVSEIKQSIIDNKPFSLKNCLISYNSHTDSKYLTMKSLEMFGDFEFINIDEDLHLKNNFLLSNCYFSNETVLKNFQFENVSITNTNISLDKVLVDFLDINGSCNVENSKINFLSLWSDKKELTGWNAIENNIINCLSVRNYDQILISENKISALKISGELETCSIRKNIFHLDLKNISQVIQKDENIFFLNIQCGLKIDEKSTFSSLILDSNVVNVSGQLTESDIIINTLDSLLNNPPPVWTPFHIKIFGPNDGNFKFNKLLAENIFSQSSTYAPLTKEQLILLKEYNQKNNLKFNYNNYQNLTIRGVSIDDFFIKNNSFNEINIESNKVFENLEFSNNTSLNILNFKENKLPDKNRIILDESVIYNLGFKISNKNFFGTEDYKLIKDYINTDEYQFALSKLIVQYREFINIFNENGSDNKVYAVIKLKDVQTNKKEYDYMNNPSVNNWFNWRGGQFLKWYADYGMNPFKALAYCFWTMMYFAMFYFFFSEWDKIGRGYLVKKFNNIIDYFTSEKRIEDFYASQHQEEMSTFYDFKNTLEKNKVHMPFILSTIARPIYQFSFLRYKVLKFFYNRAEFMAGRKWDDLPKKERYGLGGVTILLSVFYIFYLLFIRALNSITLSINAFSTLGFGNIPVKGFTKYIAILEGFIGWFLLSVFIVSLLNQMMTI